MPIRSPTSRVPFLELDHGDGKRVVEPAHLGVMDDDEAVDRPAAHSR